MMQVARLLPPVTKVAEISRSGWLKTTSFAKNLFFWPGEVEDCAETKMDRIATGWQRNACRYVEL
jgi:hypothetical protein